MIYQIAKQVCEQTGQQIPNIFNSISNICKRYTIKPTSIDFEIKDSKLHTLLINDVMFTRGKSNHWERV